MSLQFADLIHEDGKSNVVWECCAVVLLIVSDFKLRWCKMIIQTCSRRDVVSAALVDTQCFKCLRWKTSRQEASRFPPGIDVCLSAYWCWWGCIECLFLTWTTFFLLLLVHELFVCDWLFYCFWPGEYSWQEIYEADVGLKLVLPLLECSSLRLIWWSFVPMYIPLWLLLQDLPLLLLGGQLPCWNQRCK